MDRLLPYCWKQGKVVSTVATGTAGGLAILWNPSTTIMENFITTRWSITADYRLIGSNKPGHLSNVYGPASSRDKQAFLSNLEYLSTLTKERRWLLGGDFNLIRNLDEKKGGIRCLEQESSDFQNLLDNTNLIDLETSNGTFTWTNRRTGIHQIACRTGSVPYLRLPPDGRHSSRGKHSGFSWVGPLAYSAMDGCDGHPGEETLQV
jgi:hypothetical protein